MKAEKINMDTWNKVSEKFPKTGAVVITWNGKEFRICRYKKVLTWKGYKFKFVNVMSKGFWNNDETHWTYFPNPPAPDITYSSCLHPEKYRFTDRDGNIRCSDCHKAINK